jgi:hypothetical protein
MMFIEVAPVYGKNYTAGHAFFTRCPGTRVDNGIGWHIHKDEDSPDYLLFTHCGICIGENRGIESTFFGGVHEVDLRKKYFDSDKYRIVFREPRMLNIVGADELIRISERLINLKLPYDFKLIIGQSLARNPITKNLFPEEVKQWILRMFNQENRYICSELVACIYYKSRIIDELLSTVNPQELFQHGMFRRWKYDRKNGKV